jgi:CheY-like chemotaxis protein
MLACACGYLGCTTSHRKLTKIIPFTVISALHVIAEAQRHPFSARIHFLDVSFGGSVVNRELLRVLVADDHEKMRICLVQILEREFSVVAAVADGYELIEAATRLKPDVIVSDVQMPHLTGPEAMMTLNAGGAEIPFVFVCSDQDMVMEVTQNFSACIHKVDALTELGAAVRCATATLHGAGEAGPGNAHC